MSDPFYVYRPLLDLIGKTEGTDPSKRRPRARGYNETLAYGAYTGGDRNLVTMTLDEIDHLQTAMLAHPDNHWNSSAIGRYQIVRKTLRSIRRKLKLAGSERFHALMQDRMACYLLGRRGVDRYLVGKLSEDAFINALAKEWASLPTTQDRGHYSGQHAAVNSAEVRKVLAEVRRRFLDPKPAGKPQDTQKPVPPATDTGKVDNGAPAPAQESRRGIWAAILAALGIGSGGALTQAEADQLGAWILGGAIIAAVIVVAVILWRRRG